MCHVEVATEMVEVMGANVETQTCYVQDSSGNIKLQLWAGQIGLVLCGQSYQMRNLSTREYLGSVFLTTTRNTEIVAISDVAGASSFEHFEAEEEQVTSFVGSIIRAEIAVSKKCTKCQAWQLDFNTAVKFHRCQRCKFLQKAEHYQCTASGRVALLHDGNEMDLHVTNSVITRYLQQEGISDLLIEGQNVEEHLLSGDAWKVRIQRDVVVTIGKVVETAGNGPSEEQEVAGAMAAIDSEDM